MARQPVPDISIDDVTARLTAYSQRLRGSTYRAIHLHETFASFNDPANPLRQGGAYSIASTAVNVLLDAALRELILILVRTLDQPRGHVLQSDKVSFPVVLQLASLPGVRDRLTENARAWLEGDNADQNAEAVSCSLDLIAESLERLGAEAPNRSRLLRDFRDEFLAHELQFDAPRARPLYRDLAAMVLELEQLSAAASMAFEGADVAWDHAHEQGREPAIELWRVIRSGADSNLDYDPHSC